MYIGELIDRIKRRIPEDNQEAWDNSGPQLIDREKEISSIVLALDLLEETIDFAIENSANLIITHHPLFFKDNKSLDLSSALGRKVKKLIENNISVYSMHTNFDLDEHGVSTRLADLLRLEKKGCIEETKNLGYGVYGRYRSGDSTILDLAQEIKEKLQLDHVLIYGKKDKKINRIGLMGGSGASFVKNCINLNLDVYVTGDIKHHDALDAVEGGLALIDISHYYSEHPSLEYIRELILDLFEVDVKIFKSPQKYLRMVY